MGEAISAQMKNILDLEKKEVKEVTERSMKEVAGESVDKLKATSPKAHTKKGGRYARGWRTKTEGEEVIVYNATDWQLTHLLENGHNVVNRFGDTGARANPVVHIKPVEEWAKNEFPIRISRGLK